MEGRETENQPKEAAECSHNVMLCLATNPSLLLRVGSVHRLGSLRLWDRDLTTDETNYCMVEETPKDILDQNAHFLCEDGTSWCETFCPPLRNVMTRPFRNLKIFAVKGIHEIEELVNHGPNELGHVCIQYLRTYFASGSLDREGAGTLICALRRYGLLARSCGADLEDHQSVFRTLWCVHRIWPPRHPDRVQNTCVTKSCRVWQCQIGFTMYQNFHFQRSCRFIVCVQRRPGNFDGAT